MKFTPGTVSGTFVIDQERRQDERGYFARTWCMNELASQGLCTRIAQVNTAFSPAVHTLRGLHFQEAPWSEVKVVRCTRGAIYDVVADLRPQSPTCRAWFGVELSADNGRELYIPEGCAHGYLTLLPDTEVEYLTSQKYVPQSARGVRYDDPALDITWPQPPAVVSAADRSWPPLGPQSRSDE